MRISIIQSVSVLAIAVGTASAVPGGAQAQERPRSATPADSDSSTYGGLAEIIVTAQRREQNLQLVPISVTALNEDALTANRVRDVLDLSSVAPNLSVRQSPGGTNIPQYTLRGVYTTGASAGSDRGVALYVDGVYLQNAEGSVFQLADIERVEVLKGPQGTLFGRNATGGAISITTRDPAGEFHVLQELTYGNYNQFRSKSRVDLPAFGPLSLSATYLHSEREGDIKNLGAGAQWTVGSLGVLTSPQRLGNDNLNAVAVGAKLGLEDFTAVYKFDYAREHYSPDGNAPVYINTSPGVAGPAGPLVAAELAFQAPGVVPALTTVRPGAVNNWFTTPAYSRTDGHNLTLTYRPSDVVTIKDIASYREVTTYATTQFDPFGGLRNVVPMLGPVGAPFLLLGIISAPHESQWSNEAQVHVKTNWMDLTAGYLHFHNHQFTGSRPGLPVTVAFKVAPNFVIPQNGSLQSEVDVNSDAVYVQPEFHITPQLDLALGARYTKDAKNGTDNSIYTTANPVSFPIRYSGDKTTYLADIDYRPTDNILTYAKFATGYISGGFVSTLAYRPETVESYEAGVKADLLDRHLRVNLAAFNANYDNLQLTIGGTNLDPTNARGLRDFSQVVINAGKSRARGFELETTAIPVRGLTLTGNIGLTDFKFTQLDPILLPFGPANVTSLYGRPRWTGQLAAQHETAPMIAEGRLVVRIDADVKSKEIFTIYYPDQAFRDALTVGTTWLLNARLALTDANLFGTRGTVALWGRNILDNKDPVGGAGALFAFGLNYQHATTYGVDLNINF